MARTNRLAVELSVKREGLDKLRATKDDLRDMEGAANKAERGVDKLGDEFSQTGRKANDFGRSVSGASNKTDALARVAGGAVSKLVAIGAAAAAAAASLATIGSIRVGAGFEEQMSAVLAITRATGDEFLALSEKARELGATTVFSAKEAADGMEFLARAGFNANQIIGALPGTLNLAAAGALDLGEAADIASNVLTGFGLAAEEANRVSDVLAKAAASSNTNVQQLGEGMKFVAPIAAGLGVSLEETTAAIGKLSDAGLQASVAGTGLRRILSELASPSEQLANLLGGLSIEADGFSAVMKHLAEQSISTGEALEIFGDRGGPAFTVLIESFKDLDANGVSAVENLAGALENASGFAEETAKTMTDNFNGAVKQARSALEELFITAATDGGALEALTASVDALTIALRSDAAKEFAERFGNAMRDATYAILGLVSALNEIKNIAGDVYNALKPVADLFETVFQIDVVRDVVGNAAGRIPELGRATAEFNESVAELEAAMARLAEQIDEILADRKRLFEGIEQADGSVTTRFDIIAEQTIAPEFLDGFKRLSGLLGELAEKYPAVAKGADDLSAANDNVASSLGPVEQSLREQLEVAQRLANAAEQGGKTRFDIELNTIELDELARKAVEQAAEAGEKLSFETARTMLSHIDSLNRAAEAFIEAEQQLRNQAAASADNIAAGLQDRIASFARDASRADLSRGSVVDALEERFQNLIDEIDETSIGLDTDQLEELYGNLEEVGVSWREEIQDAFDYGAERFARRLNLAIGDTLDDLIFNGGRGLGDMFERLARNAVNDNFINPIADAITGEGSIFENIQKSFKTQVEGFQKAFGDVAGATLSAGFSGFQGFEIGKGLSDLLGISGNKASQQAGGAVGGGLGAAAGLVLGGPVGASIGAAIGSALGNIVGGLFSKHSNRTAQAVFDPSTGFIAGAQDDNAPENARIRDEIVGSITDITKVLADTIGASSRNLPGDFANEKFLNLAIRSDRNTGEPFIELGFQGADGAPFSAQRFDATEEGARQAIEEAVRLAIQSFRGGEDALLSFAQSAAEAGRPIEEIGQVLGVLSEALDSGKEQLAEYAKAAALGGLSADEIVEGINLLDRALSLTVEPLSNVEQALKDIDDAIDPAIAALKEVGESFEDIAQIGQEAGRAVGKSFIEAIEKQTAELTNAPLAAFRELLEAQKQDLEDAALLLERGFISPDEFRLVQQRNALQQTSFFEGLDQDELNQLGDYLGLIRDNGGETAVALFEFNKELDRTKDSLTTGLSAMREEADRFLSAAQANFNLSEDIRLRLSGETGTAQLATFRAELQGLLVQTQGGDVTAAERAPDIARQFIELAERQLGGSAGLASARDFVTDILDQIGAAAQAQGDERLNAIELAERQVSVLDDIKEILSSPDPAIDLLETIRSNGEIQSAALRDLLDQFIQASYNSPAQNYTPGDVQQAAQQFIIPSDLRITNTVTTESPGTAQAINNAAERAAESAETQQETLDDIKRAISEMGLAITKLDATLRAA